MRRRRTNPSPRSPLPIRTSDVGSGTAVNWPVPEPPTFVVVPMVITSSTPGGRLVVKFAVTSVVLLNCVLRSSRNGAVGAVKNVVLVPLKARSTNAAGSGFGLPNCATETRFVPPARMVPLANTKSVLVFWAFTWCVAEKLLKVVLAPGSATSEYVPELNDPWT